MTKAAQIREILASSNNLSIKQIARQTGVTESMVYYARSTMKKRARLAKVIQTITKGKSKKASKPITNVIVPTKHDRVNSPAHYTAGGIETIDFIKAKLTKEQYEGYLLGNIIKYSSRIGLKGEAKVDAGKLHWYTRELEKRIAE